MRSSGDAAECAALAAEDLQGVTPGAQQQTHGQSAQLSSEGISDTWAHEVGQAGTSASLIAQGLEPASYSAAPSHAPCDASMTIDYEPPQQLPLPQAPMGKSGVVGHSTSGEPLMVHVPLLPYGDEPAFQVYQGLTSVPDLHASRESPKRMLYEPPGQLNQDTSPTKAVPVVDTAASSSSSSSSKRSFLMFFVACSSCKVHALVDQPRTAPAHSSSIRGDSSIANGRPVRSSIRAEPESRRGSKHGSESADRSIRRIQFSSNGLTAPGAVPGPGPRPPGSRSPSSAVPGVAQVGLVTDLGTNVANNIVWALSGNASVHGGGGGGNVQGYRPWSPSTPSLPSSPAGSRNLQQRQQQQQRAPWDGSRRGRGRSGRPPAAAAHSKRWSLYDWWYRKVLFRNMPVFD